MAAPSASSADRSETDERDLEPHLRLGGIHTVRDDDIRDPALALRRQSQAAGLFQERLRERVVTDLVERRYRIGERYDDVAVDFFEHPHRDQPVGDAERGPLHARQDALERALARIA